MFIDSKQLKKVKVETQSGQYLGKIIDIELETDTGIIEKYYVKNSLSIPGLFENKLIINKNQVISFDNEKMIVEDSLLKESNTGREKISPVEKIEGPEPVITSKES